MNRNKSRFLTLVFSCFFAVFVVGNAFAVSCTSSQYLSADSTECRACSEAGPSSSAYTCGSGNLSCKSGYTLTYSRLYSYSDNGSLDAKYCCPNADWFTDAGGTKRCLSQWSNGYGWDGAIDNGATVSNHVYTCASGYTRVLKPYAGYSGTSAYSSRREFYVPQYACCLTANTYLGPDGTNRFCFDDRTNLELNYGTYKDGLGRYQGEVVAFAEEKSDGTKEFKCYNAGWSAYGNRWFRAVVLNRPTVYTTPNYMSRWDCQNALNQNGYYPCLTDYSPTGATCSSSGNNWSISCYSPITNSSGKVTGYNNNKAGYAMDGTSFRGCEIQVTLSGKTGCTNNQVVAHYDLNTSGSYAPSTVTTYSPYDIVMGVYFDPGLVETAEWLNKAYTYTAQAGYRKNTSDGTCVQCAAGYYSPAKNNLISCYGCNTGKYGTVAGASSCNGTCVAGTYTPTSGAYTSCLSCTGNTYAPNTGMWKCVTVPYNASVNSAHTDISCNAGSYKTTNPYSGEQWYYCPPCPMHDNNDGTSWYVNEMSTSGSSYTSPAGSTSITACTAHRTDSDSKGTYTTPWCSYSGDDYVTIGLNYDCLNYRSSYVGGTQYLFSNMYSMCDMGYFPWSGFQDNPESCVMTLLSYQWGVGGSGSTFFVYLPMGMAQIVYRDLYYSDSEACFTYYDSI